MATLSLLAITGSLVLLKLALMAFALILLEKELFRRTPGSRYQKPARVITGHPQEKR